MGVRGTSSARRITQAALAAELGVSQAVVSMVLGGRHAKAVSPETQERVLEVARRAGYVPDRAAQMLRARRSWTIACVLPDITNPFYPAFERGVQDVALAAGYDVLAVNTDGEIERERRLIDWAKQGRVDGLIGVFFGLSPFDLAPLEASGVPAVCVGWRAVPPGTAVIDSLFTDNRRAAQAATRHLIERGHRAIAMFAADGGPGRERADGYLAAMREAGLAPVIDTGEGFTVEAGHRLMLQRLGDRTVPRAVFAANDLIAAGAMLALREAGRSVPDEVAIVGFDDIPLARLLFPALTTVDQFQHGSGREAARMLLDRLADPTAFKAGRSRETPFALVRRQSA